MPRLIVLAAALALIGTGSSTVPARAQGVAPGGSIANTTGIGSGLATQGGTSPSYPNGTTQPTLAPPPPPGGGSTGGVAPTAPRAAARPSTIAPPSYSFETRRRKPAVVPLDLPAAAEADIGFLKGCWRTDVFQHAGQTGLATWCFSGKADGKVMYTRINQPDFFCHGPAEATYRGGTLHLGSATLACNDGGALAVGDLDCRQGSDGAQCSGGVPTVSLTERWTVRLYRVR
jgi:hypothetical protein